MVKTVKLTVKILLNKIKIKLSIRLLFVGNITSIFLFIIHAISKVHKAELQIRNWLEKYNKLFAIKLTFVY